MSSASKTNAAALLLAVAVMAAVVASSHALLYKGPVDDLPVLVNQPAFMQQQGLLSTGLGNIKHGNKLRGSLLLDTNTTDREIFAGQEARLLVSTAFLGVNDNGVTTRRMWTRLRGRNVNITTPAFNVSAGNVRVRVIAAYSSRTAFSGVTRKCADGDNHDVWAEIWGLSPRSLVFGKSIVVSGYATFTVPPFEFRLCVKDITRHNTSTFSQNGQNSDRGLNRGWKEFQNLAATTVYHFAEPLYYFQAASDNQAGDYAAIKIVARGYKGRYNGKQFNPRRFTLGDVVKLVPFGFPCTYEKPTSTTGREAMSGTGAAQYCGTNYVNQHGNFLTGATCQWEGSVGEGVARIGTNRQNPLSTSTTPGSYTLSGTMDIPMDNAQFLTAYVKLPEAGNYDICVSTNSFRRVAFNASLQVTGVHAASDAQPLWFKAYDGRDAACAAIGTNGGILPAACMSRATALTVAAATFTDVTYAIADRTHNTWGTIKFTGTNLNYNPATAWDHSATREYATHAGGDMFRIVPEAHFTANPQTLFGEVYKDAKGAVFTTTVVTQEANSKITATSVVSRASATYSGASLLTAGNGKFVQYKLGQPGFGTQSNINTGSGCFWGGEDNYGASALLGNPGSQCCSSAPCSTANFCALSEANTLGPKSNADLGGNPRHPYAPWLADGTGANAWGYVRIPSGGRHKICYRRANGNWRVISWTGSATKNTTFAPMAKNAGYEYYINDTRAETWGAWGVKSRSGATLTTEPSNFWDAAAVPAAAKGSMFKIVTSDQSCHLATAQAHGYSANAGLLEGAGSKGSADDSSDARQWIYFYARVPKDNSGFTPAYRICFRFGEDNWHALTNPNYTPVYDGNVMLNSADLFYPMPKPLVEFTLGDNTQDTWGQFIIKRHAGHVATTQALNTMPNHDQVRLVPNATNGKENFCDRVVGGSDSPQEVVLAREDRDLGAFCAASSGTASDYCFTGKLTPTDGGVNALFPYTMTSPAADANSIAAVDGALAFIKLPSAVNSMSKPQGYKVCYKQHATANWIEATSAAYGTVLTIKAPNTVALTGASSTITAGQYGFLRLSAPATHGIYWANDVLKLVPVAHMCDAPAAGSPSHTGEAYGAIVNRGGALSYAVFSNAENVSQVQSSWNVAGQPPTTTAAAFFVFPTGAGSTAASSAEYRVCYMRRPTAVATLNWKDVGVITVVDLGIVFAVRQEPQRYAYLQVDVISGGAVRLNTNPGMDAAKIVASTSPCTIHQAAFVSGTTYLPNLAGSFADHVSVYPVDASGVSDLGPGNEVGNRALLEVLMPNSGSTFKVCYKPFGREWIQLVQSATFAHRGFNLTSSTFSLASAAISSYSVGSSVLGLSPFSSSIIAGAPISSSGHLGINLATSDAAATATTIKFVKTDFEAPAGVYTTIPGRSCFSDGFQTSYTTTVGTSTLYTPWGFPLESGKYLLCVWRNNNWHFAFNGARNPTLTIVDSELRFSRSGNVITITDYYGNTTHSFGSLNGEDTVYVVNGSGTCGDNSFNNVAPATAERKLNGTSGATSANATHFVAVRVTDGAITLPTAIGSYKVCVKKSQQTASYSDGVAPFLRSGVYYQVASSDDNPFLNVGGATQLRISGCNTTVATAIAAGASVDLTVTQLDGSGLVYPIGGTTTAATYANLATLAGVTSDFKIRNFGGACRPQDATRFGFGEANLEQYLFGGSSTFRVAFESNCPGGSCSVRFSSGSLTSSACAFTVSTTPLTAVEVVNYPTAPCRIGTPCTFRAAALGASALAYAATDAVTVAVAGNAGLAVSGTTSGAFANGYFTFQLTFNPSSFAALSPTTTVSVAVITAANVTSPAVSFTVIAPSFSAVHIVDVFPADVAGLGVRPLTPTWEPSTGNFYGSNADAAAVGLSSVVAGSGFHLVAQQFYTVVLRAVGTWPGGEQTYLNSVNLVDQSKAITIDTAGLNAAQRVITAAGCTGETCNGALGATAFNAVRVSVTFRLQNNAGCSRASPCTLPFKFGGGNIGASPTQLTTPVRMVASRLVTQCDKDSNFASRSLGVPPAVTSTCTGKSSTVNEGWFLQVTAVDQSGVFVDEFFDGHARAIFDNGMDGWDNGQGVKLTSTAMLQSGWANATTAAFSMGQATFRGLTVSRPCATGNCPIQVVSNWGANIVDAGELVATPNTASLSCSLSTPLMYCSVASGVCTPTTTPSADTLLYTDTQICVAVEAKDSNGANTLYESNWVHYFAADKGTTKIPLTITDNSGNTAIVKRYKPMRFGRATFCFSVAGTISSRIDFDVTFVAQRFNDAGYWANGATGRCSVGPYALWPKKQVAGLRIVSAAGVELLSGANTNSALLAGLRTGSSALVSSLTLKAVDHYGRDITATNVDENGNRFQVAVVQSSGNVAVATSGMTQIRGLLNVTVDDATTTRNVNSTVVFGLNLYQYCLGCSITFQIVDSGAADPTAAVAVTQIPSSGISPSATARFFVVNADATAVRRLAFYPGSSPLSYWVNGTADVNLTASNPPVLHQSSCLTTSCKPIATTFLLPVNDARGAASTITTSGSNDIRMQVLTVDAAGSLNSLFEPTGTTLATATAQLDILNSYTVNVQIGNQALKCTGSLSCTDDGTTSVKQTIAAYGATLRDAVLAFPASDASTRMTQFKLQGLNPSAYAPIMADGRIADSTLPSVSGSFAATATAVAPTTFTVTGITTPGQVFVWRPIAQPRRLVVLGTSATADLANPTKTWNYFASASTAQAQLGTASEVAHQYTTEWPVGIAFPITVEVQDVNNFRASVSGTVNVAVVEWSGCNNGGLLSASGSLVNGRATIALTFTTPCQNCVLEFELATPSGAEWSAMLANPRSVLAYSAPLNIVAARPSNNEHVVVTAATPDIFATSTTTLTVADAVALTLEGRAANSNLAASRISYTTTNGYTAAVYNRVNSVGNNGWWVGNGGVLRSNTAQGLHQHHLAETTGASLSFMFTRTCASCSVYLMYRFNGAATSATLMLPTNFVVRTAGSIGTTVVGFVPRQVERGDDIAVALWHTVTDGGIVAGLPTTGSLSSARTVSATATDRTNGDGGILQATSWLFPNSEVHRITFSRPSNGITVSAGSDSFPLVVTTTATHLRPIFASQTANIITASLGTSRTFSLRAVDDLGFTDVTVGANSCSFGGIPFYCPAASGALPVSTTITADGTGAPFPSSESTMIFAQQDHTTTGSIAHGQGTVSVRFNSPIRAGVPVFSIAGPLSSHLSGNRPAFQLPVVTVSNGLRALELVAIPVSDKTKVSTAGAWFVDVALVNAMTDDVTPANRYVAVSASNTVTMTTSGCSALSLTTATSFQLDRGYRRVPISFLDAATGCSITFTASSCTGAACTTAITGVSVKKVTADSFQFLRPTTLDNNGAAAGPRFGAAGRKTYVTVQLYGADGNNVAVPVGSSACPSCALRITNPGSADTNCGFTPSKTSETFDVNGTATIALTWNDANVARYTCTVKVEVGTDSNFATLLKAPDASNAHTAAVTVCRPVRVVMITNTSTAYRGTFLRTGAPYAFEARTVDATGARCFGDSQDEATQLTVEAVTTGTVPALSTQIFVTNLNRTETTTAAVANGQQSADVARTTVRAVAGQFVFAVAFSNSTVALGLPGVRVRVTATSVAPDISGNANKFAYSGPVETVIAAATLRFAPNRVVPRNIVTNRVIQTAPNRTSEDVVVQAVDALNPQWAPASLATAPNVARRSTEAGNDAPVFWQQTPPPIAGVIPLTFKTGALTGSLRAGEATWSGLTWTGADGQYELTVASAAPGSPIRPAQPFRFFAQNPVRLALDVTNFTASTATVCAANCELSNRTFTRTVNASIDAAPFLVVESLRAFNVSVFVGDGADAPVLGDSESVIEATIVGASAATSVQFGRPPAFRELGSVFARVRNGVAHFELGFLGSTAINGNGANHSLVEIQFSCPATRPAHLVMPFETAANPCALASFKTMKVLVNDRRPANLFRDAPTTNRDVLKVEFAVSDLAALNITRFINELSAFLEANGFPWVNVRLAQQFTSATVCGVTQFFDIAQHDLVGVCGQSGACNILTGALNCPPQVLACRCPNSAARGAMLSRYLLQAATSNATANYSSVVGEFYFDLQYMPGFPGFTEAALAQAYAALQTAARSWLALPSVSAEYKVSRAATRSFGFAGNQATLQPTPVPFVPPAPTPAPPPPATEDPEPDAAAPFSVLLAAALGLLLALLA